MATAHENGKQPEKIQVGTHLKRCRSREEDAHPPCCGRGERSKPVRQNHTAAAETSPTEEKLEPGRRRRSESLSFGAPDVATRRGSLALSEGVGSRGWAQRVCVCGWGLCRNIPLPPRPPRPTNATVVTPAPVKSSPNGPILLNILES